MDRELIRYIGDTLAAPCGSLTKASVPARTDAIEEAKTWSSGPSPKQKVITEFYRESEYTVSLAKPGKEAAADYTPLNAWDMTPVVHFEGSDVGYLPSFSDLFSAIQTAAVASATSHRSIELLGHLFARSAYMLDHVRLADGRWRYHPPAVAMGLLHSEIPFVDGLPISVFLQVIEAIALNEDVKYTSRAGELSTAGRVNTMLTLAHLCAVFVDRAGLGDFAGAFARPPLGLSPLSQHHTRRIFPLLEPDSVRKEVAERALLIAQTILGRFRGRTASDIFEQTPGSPVSPGNKGRLRLAVDRLLAASLNTADLERVKKGATLKVIRVSDDLTPAEDVSFANFDVQKLLTTPWPKSQFRDDVLAPILFVLFSESPRGDERLIDAYPVLIPLEDIETDALAAWRRALEALRAARRDLMPLGSEGPFFVRNHSGKKVVNDAGESITPQSFWLSRRYVRDLLLRA